MITKYTQKACSAEMFFCGCVYRLVWKKLRSVQFRSVPLTEVTTAATQSHYGIKIAVQNISKQTYFKFGNLMGQRLCHSATAQQRTGEMKTSHETGTFWCINRAVAYPDQQMHYSNNILCTAALRHGSMHLHHLQGVFWRWRRCIDTCRSACDI